TSTMRILPARPRAGRVRGSGRARVRPIRPGGGSTGRGGRRRSRAAMSSSPWRRFSSLGRPPVQPRRSALRPPERARCLLGLVDLVLVPDVVERVGHLGADADRTRLVAAEQRGIVSVKAVADRLHVALVAARRVLIVTMILGSRHRVVAIDAGIATELV